MRIPTMKSFFLLSCFLLLGCEAKRRSKGRTHRARIMERPNDVPVVKCGEDIKLTCIAEGDPAPEIEWWFYNRQQKANKTIVRQAGRDGRVRMKVEEFYVVRSTLMIKGAEEDDEGIYQCRASNSEMRAKENVNVYLHWKVEEAPVNKVVCRDSVTSTTQVFRASEYSQAVFDDVVDRTTASISSTAPPKVKVAGGKKKEDPTPDPPVTSHTRIVTSSKPAKIATKKSTNPPVTPQTKTVTSSKQAKIATKKPTKKPAAQKPVKHDRTGNEIEKPPIIRGPRNDVPQQRATPPSEPKGPSGSKDAKDPKERKNALVISTTGPTGGAKDTSKRSYLVLLLHLPVAAFVLTMSSF